MDLSFSDDQRLLNESVDRFVTQGYDFATRRKIAASPTRFSTEVWTSLAKFGWLGLPMSVADGGYGGDAVDVGIVMEGIGKGLVLEPYLSSVVICAGLISQAGSAAQRAMYLPKIADATLCVAFAHGESMFKSLGGATGTSALRQGEHWILQGSKCLVLDAPGADQILVSALDAAGALQLFMVGSDQPGLSRQDFETLDGRLAANLKLDQVEVRESHRFANVPALDQLIIKTIDTANAALCAEAVGCLQYLLDTTVSYTRTRVQFERAIANNQVLRHRMVDMAIQCEEARALALRAALAIERAPLERMREVSSAKVKIVRAARIVCEGAVQLHGAMGVTDELDVGSYVKRLLSFEKTWGTPLEHRARLVELRGQRAA